MPWVRSPASDNPDVLGCPVLSALRMQRQEHDSDEDGDVHVVS